MENMTPAEYKEKFDRVRRYSIDGDCYQVNLTKRFSCEVSGSGWATYRQLRDDSPAPYGAFLQLPFAEVLSNSPENFIQCRQGKVSTRPIKGTRPRDHRDQERDKEIARELKNSEKDRAENLMIVDLMRNDLSRCCETGSVEVPKLFALHSFANVHHLISTITGKLRQDLHVLDLLRSCFPGGSITGAPKIRAMEIIEELEPHRRGLYCGAIGYVGLDGSLETNIAIRTIVVKDGVARFSAGGGLVIDSVVDDEYQELLDKARMMRGVLFPHKVDS
jgi:para-aminobenzoate synthetase component 1